MICNLCGKQIERGNNPYPLCDEHSYHRCCDECNTTKVIPARILMFKYNISKQAKVGDTIQIIWLENDPMSVDYTLRTGIVESIDDMGNLHGTWGSLSLIPNTDKYVILEEA